MDASIASPGEPDRLSVLSERGTCSENATDELDGFCSESLRSIDRTVMRAQVIELILDILATTDVRSESRHRLLQHLASHPGSPEQALLCHLSENACLPPATGPDCLAAGGDFPSGAGDASMEGSGDRANGSKSRWLPDPLRSLLRRE